MIALGIDPGLAFTGWALVDNFVLKACGAVVTKKDRRATGDAQRRLAEVAAALHPLVHRHDLDLVVVEWPSGGGFGRTKTGGNVVSAAQTNLVAGLAAGLAWGAGHRVRAPSPITWRTGLGASRGRDVELHVEIAERHAAFLASARIKRTHLPHVLDAIGLAEFAMTNSHTEDPC